MKLILAVDALTPSLSGIGRYAWELTSRLAQAGDIDRIRYIRNGRWVGDPAALLADGYTDQSEPFSKYPRWAKKFCWQQTCKGEVFHSPNYFLPEYADKGVATVHDLSVFKFPETHPVERVKHFEKSFDKTLKIASHLITDSEVTRQEVMAYFSWPGDKISAIHLGVSPLFASRAPEDLKPVLQPYGLHPGGYSLCVSTIEPRKRIDSLLEAYARLPAHLLAAYPLVLVGGKGWRSDHLHIMIEAGQRAGWLHYLGFVSEVDLPAIYAGAHLFMFPSIYEGFGLPVIEAMASGVPVITSNRSTLPEVSSGATMLVDPDDQELFLSSIRTAIEDTSWRAQAIKNGLAAAKKYNWDVCLKKTMDVYRNI
ncbi:glycosyltransferase involved in cell wall biosynthesis [Undibacterium sp. GrIS 1.2]|uniref:glycosyltransferase family 4 protein n=1 Tax=Undibacterium sp. GrIS 1.2 TaxID=3143933 RepID=UPI003398D975